jgi:hypothetical protein
MRVFLSYASKDRDLAERVCRVLETEGHDVFFDRDDLGGGDAFGQRIRGAIRRSHVLVYLISQASVTPPSYALTELSHATDPRPSRGLTILPVRTDATPIASVPAALRAYTILEPQGDVPAEIASAVDRIGRRRRRRMLMVAAAAAVVTMMLVAGYMARRPVTLAVPDASVSAGGATFAPSGAGASGPGRPPVARDPIDELSRSIVERTPAERRVTLIGLPTNQGWMATLVIADPSVTDIRYRLDGESTYTSTGTNDLPNLFTGRPQPKTHIQMPGEFWSSRTLSVQYTDVNGREHGPFELPFDPREQFVRSTRQVLDSVDWVTFRKEPATTPLAYFTALLSYKRPSARSATQWTTMRWTRSIP